MRKAVVKKILSLLSVMTLLASFFSFGLQAAAANDTVVLTIVSNSDVNPLIRFYAMKENGFDKGGPFKVEFEWKADIKRMPGKDEMNCFSGIYEMNNDDAKTTGTHITKSVNDWEKTGFTFINVKGCLDLGAMMPYGVINIGMWHAKGTLAIRNFKITNASGKVMYSLNDDPDIKALIKKSQDEHLSKCTLKDIGLINPTPLILAATFGDDSYDVLVTTMDGPAITTTTKHGLVIEDDPTQPNNSKTTTKAPDNKTTTADAGSVTTDPSASSATDPSASSITDSSASSTDGSMSATTSGAATTTGINGTQPVGGKNTEKKGGLPVGAIVAIVIVAVLVAAVAVLYILAGTGKVKLPFNLPFLNKGGEPKE